MARQPTRSCNAATESQSAKITEWTAAKITIERSPLEMTPGSRSGMTGVQRLSRSARLLAAFLLLGSFLSFVGTAGAAPRFQSQDAAGDAEQALFVKGQNLYSQNLYHEAIAVFGDFLKAYPQSQIKDLALLWLGRCHIRVGDVGAAEQIALRLREIPDTQFVSLFDEELRVARQSYVKAQTPTASVNSQPAAAVSLMNAAADAEPAPSVTSPPASNGQRQNRATKQIVPNESNEVKQSTIAKSRSTGPQAKTIDAALEPPKAISNSNPLVRIRLEQSPRETSVGGATFYRLLVVNEGKGVAKDLIVSELLPGELEFASSDPAPSRQETVGRSQRLTFRIAELKGGASRVLRIAVRLRVGAGAEAVLKAKHTVAYQDSDRKSYLTN